MCQLRKGELSTWVTLKYLVAKSVVAIIALLACAAAIGGDFCKWTDEDGVVHFADKCPENTETEQVEIQPPPSQDRVQAAQRRSEALLSGVKASEQDRTDRLEKQAAKSTQGDRTSRNRERCIDAMVDLHNLREGEAMYFDEGGQLHDQFSIHSASYSGVRTYIDDVEHKALIEDKQKIVLTDCVQSRDEIIARIEKLAARSDNQMCKNLYDRVLKDKRYDRLTNIEELQSTEKTVLEICN